MKSLRRGLVAAVVTLAVGGFASAAMAVTGSAGKTHLTVSKDLIGKGITNVQNVNLGTISEVIIDPSGTAQYLIVTPSRDLNLAGKSLAVPWDAVTFAQDTISVKLSKDKFAKAPVWKAENIAKSDWNTKTYDYYGLVYVPTTVQFSQLDTNKDNLLSQDEAKLNRRIGTHFKNLDKDKDGNISQSEFSAFEAVGTEGSAGTM